MTERGRTPDVRKVFAAIALILSSRENSAKVTLTSVRKKADNIRKVS